MKPKKEGLNERNDTLVVVKADGGITEVDDVYSEFGELHCDKAGITIDLQQKVPVLEPTIVGRPPVQRKTIYYLDEEPLEAGFDPGFINGKLVAAHSQSVSGNTNEMEQERRHRRNTNTFFIIMGVVMLLLAFVIAPMCGLSLKTGVQDSTAPVAPANANPGNAFPTPTPASLSFYRGE